MAEEMGRLTREGQLSSGRHLFDELRAGGGGALKLVVEEWAGLWDEDSKETAALQAVNFVLWSAGLAHDLSREELEHPDPASILNELQTRWRVSMLQIPAEGPLLSGRNKSRPAKAFRKNYSEFWSRWTSLLGGVVDVEEAKRLVLTWLLTMSSAGFRPLRMAASKACFAILRGSAGCCHALARQMDQLAGITNPARISVGAMVDDVGGQLASLEKIIQMIFDGVFVQRFRDVDVALRAESIECLTEWILAYSDVFLDNSYLRYLGWALSDRASAVRLSALHSLSRLYGQDAGTREGMEVFMQRFLPRILQMAERDVEMEVRNGACSLLSLVYRWCMKEGADDEEDGGLQEGLQFVRETVRMLQPLSREALELLLRLVFDGQSPDEFQKTASVALEKIKNPLADDQLDYAMALRLSTFVDELAAETGHDTVTRTMVVEHLVSQSRKHVAVLRDLTLWLRYFERTLGSTKVPRGNIRDRAEWEALMCRQPTPSSIMLLLQAVARYSFVFLNSTADSTRQQTDGLNNSHSQDLAKLLADTLPAWTGSLEEIADVRLLAPLFDLLALADADVFFAAWPDALAFVGRLAPECHDAESAAALVNLLRYWKDCAIDGALSMLSRLLAADAASLHQHAAQDISETQQWKDLLADGCLERMRVVSGYLPLPDVRGIVRSLNGLLEKMLVTLDHNVHGAEAIEASLLPTLLSMVANVIVMAEADGSVDEGLQMIRRCAPKDPALVLSIFARIALSKPSLLQLDSSQEEELIRFVQSHEEELGPAFNLATLYLAGVVGDPALIAVFHTYHRPGHAAGSASKCFQTLWDKVIVKLDTATLSFVQRLLVHMAEQINDCGSAERAALLASCAALMTLCDAALRKQPAARSQESLVQLHATVFEACTTLATVGGDFLDRILAPFCPHLAPNLAIELLANVRRVLAGDGVSLACPLYVRSLEKAAAARRAHPIAPRSNVARRDPPTRASRLRLQPAVAETTSEQEARSASEGERDDVTETPVREMMEGLRMSSELALPSSPTVTRKRTIRL